MMDLRPDQVFAGRYRLIKQIGQGGFSVVWLVSDQMTEDTKLALKIYSPHQGLDEQGLALFRREYAMMAGLHHPGLLKANHFDIFDRSPYLVMPYCEGGSVYDLVRRRGQVEEQVIAAILAQISSALEYLHGRGIVHQDIKPDNILMDREGRFLLTDFGISSHLRQTMMRSTQMGGRALSVAYASPERFTGQMLPASDVFALGVTVFEMATGQVPWMGAGGAALRMETPLPQLSGGYSKGLELWMQVMLQYQPHRRPSTSSLHQAATAYLNSGRWPFLESGRETTPIGPASTARATKFEPAINSTKASLDRKKEIRSDNMDQTISLLIGFVFLLIIGTIIFVFISNTSTTSDSEITNVTHDVNSSNSQSSNYEEGDDRASLPPNVISPHVSKLENIAKINTGDSELDGVLTEIITNMVYIDAGSFQMGCNSRFDDSCEEDEFYPHEVEISSFRIGKFEITQKQWKVIMRNDPNYFPNNPKYPVENVSLEEVKVFISKLNAITRMNFRLPTEQEWEYAARKNAMNNIYSGSNSLDQVGWYRENSGGHPKEVGLLSPSSVGVYDMSGNVWEWTSSLAYEYPNSPIYLGGVADRYVVRGGSYWLDQSECRVSNRSYELAYTKRYDIGFRLAYSGM